VGPQAALFGALAPVVHGADERGQAPCPCALASCRRTGLLLHPLWRGVGGCWRMMPARTTLAAVVLWVCCGMGCAPALTKPVATSLDPVPSYIAPKLPDLIAQEPVDLIAGEPAPFDLVGLHARDLNRILDALAEAVGVVRILEAQIRADRALLTEREAALLDALGVGRSNQTRSAAAGFAAGVAVGALGVGIACGATR